MNAIQTIHYLYHYKIFKRCYSFNQILLVLRLKPLVIVGPKPLVIACRVCAYNFKCVTLLTYCLSYLHVPGFKLSFMFAEMLIAVRCISRCLLKGLHVMVLSFGKHTLACNGTK